MVFKALKKLMLKLRVKAHVEFIGIVEFDELYINVGLRGRCNSVLSF